MRKHALGPNGIRSGASEMVLEYLKGSPRAFKILVASALIENMAFGLVIPFFAIYMEQEIEISLPLIGIVLAGYTIAGMPATVIGGMLADKIGRKAVLLASLGLMSITMLMYIFASNFYTLLAVAMADSFVGFMYMPAANAMLADVIPSEKRPHAYSTLRIAWNVGIVFGPVAGAILVEAYSMKLLFIFGSLILASAFIMNVLFIRETKSNAVTDKITFRSVAAVANDHPFLVLCVLTGIFWFFFSQWISVLPIYAYNQLGMSEGTFGLLFAVSALMTIIFQLWVTSKMLSFRRSAVLVVGQLVAAGGFALIFYANDFYSLLACIMVITVGEIIYMSMISAVIADMAPEEKRGIYMGFSGLIQTLGQGIGFLFGMWLLDTMAVKEQIWLVFGFICGVTTVGYVVFAKMVRPDIDKPKKMGSRDHEMIT
ncbi:MAG: MFS transporter [Thermoplasmata archaeon]|nr:MFS transporter [Thermoplasmata archaeon]